MDSFEIHLDQENELKFKVSIEGTDDADLKYQLVLESEKMNCCFPGWLSNTDEVHILIPKLQKTIKEGTYNSRLEVIIDDKIFTPLEMQTIAKKQVKVMAEAVAKPKTRTPIVTSAAIIKETPSRNIVKPKAQSQNTGKKHTKRKKQLDLSNLTEDQVRALARKILINRRNKTK